MSISNFRDTKKYTKINGQKIAWIESGEGEPIVLLHGNPTSSFLWRNVIPQLSSLGRVIAPDLIGHGDSDKLPASDGAERYSFTVAYDYFCDWLEAIDATDRLTLVVHDWGGGLGFHWAKQHPDAVKGIAYMETLVMPVSWEDWPKDARGIFQGFRSDKGEDLILQRNLFIEGVLPNSVIRQLSDAEMVEYRRPFIDQDNRQVTLNWPRQIPIDGQPANMASLVQEYGEWMASNSIPKLFINADPGSILVGAPREFCRRWPNQQEVTVKGLHFIQ